jgi:hypothetical protein
MGQLCRIAEVQMQEAKSLFRAYTVKENQNDLFQLRTPSMPTYIASNNKCSTCDLAQQLLIVNDALERCVNFTARITERKPTDIHRKQYQSAKISNIEQSDVMPGDNGQSLFDQMFPLYTEEKSKYEGNMIACVNKGLVFDELYQYLLDHINAKMFVNMEHDCVDMLDYLEKRKVELVCTNCEIPTLAYVPVDNDSDDDDSDVDDNYVIAASTTTTTAAASSS